MNSKESEALLAPGAGPWVVLRELDRLCLVIESAVRQDDPRNHPSVLALIKANQSLLAIQASSGEHSEALLPCPFCGESLTINSATLGVHSHESDCILAKQVVVADHPPQVAAWNRRAAAKPHPVVVPGSPSRCKHCDSPDVEWFAHVRVLNDVPHGRLNAHDVGCVFVLGCAECSETLHVVKADDIASLLVAPAVAPDDEIMEQRNV
ncbi:hypothetical protein N7359_01825 [Stenotrophomonas maltophilia]|uniref:hypothetical protein n=1 Tax=Stenotrophomonas maltophilia TaxID=40324 RepID=UPI002447C3F3|nr:hypothetical protein [Stenotrophomonas maltophilia]MDH0071280.1 hypothetical protein [Stenotrophomonas maltophilia]MDH0104123.1 hypothetical protein [Stenotrophomonas maltophilia]MDH0330228.1 hypothetical protein [Stenotrophomonas maltophilia]